MGEVEVGGRVGAKVECTGISGLYVPYIVIVRLGIKGIRCDIRSGRERDDLIAAKSSTSSGNSEVEPKASQQGKDP